MDTVSVVVGILIGLVVGGFAVHILLLSRTRESVERAKELGNRLESAQQQMASQAAEVARLAATLEERERAHEERLKAYEDAEGLLRDTFKALSAETLRQSTSELVKQAEEVLKRYRENAEGDLSARQKAIDALLQPMKETLAKLEEANQAMERRRSGAYAELMEQVRALNEQQARLHAETGRLVKALQDPGSAGSWGEMVLERVLEMSGLQEDVNFKVQQTTGDGEDRQRPDVHVYLTEGRVIVIDSKAPMRAYLDALATDGAERENLMRAHAAKLLEHSKELARRDYSRAAASPEFTVMFIGSEGAFRAAVEARPSLLEEALEKHRVIIATPSTLLALLKAVHYGWQQARLAEAARQVQEDGRRLYEAVCRLKDHYDRLGRALAQAGKAYNDFGGSLESKLLPAARRFKDAGLSSSSELGAFEPAEFTPRPLSSSEFSREAELPMPPVGEP